jgi:hypothetical protein
MSYKSPKITDFQTQTTNKSVPTANDKINSSSERSLFNFKIQVTNSFTIQFSYLSQLLQYAIQNTNRIDLPRSEYVTHLGLTRRHTEALFSVAIAFDLINPRKLTITQIGKTIAEGDPYLENVGTLWMLHYIISSNKKWLIWNTLMNETFPTKQTVTKEEAKTAFDYLAGKLSKFTMTKKVHREINIVLDAYTTKGFGKLSLIQKEENSYSFNKITDVPPEILTAVILIFRQRYHSNASAISMEALTKESNSPGRILNIEEEKIRKILEEAKNKELLYIERKADLDQIRFREGITVESLLKMYYEGMKK